jgi:hypothetical protein
MTAPMPLLIRALYDPGAVALGSRPALIRPTVFLLMIGRVPRVAEDPETGHRRAEHRASDPLWPTT